MGSREKLFEIADSQQGFFTAQQAGAAGIALSHHHRMVQSGQWVREGRGIFRLASYPTVAHPDLVIYSLWSRNMQGVPQGVWSHDTALNIYAICDVNPAKLHMTVPTGFRRRSPTPRVLHLHYGNLRPDDLEMCQGYRMTTLIRTLNDVVAEATLAEDLILQALREALRKGVLWRDLLHAQGSKELLTYLRQIDDSKVQNSHSIPNQPRK